MQQFPTPFWGTVFCSFSWCYPFFLVSALKSLEIEVFDWWLKNFNQLESVFQDLRQSESHSKKIELHHIKKYKKLCCVRSCINFRLKSLVPLERGVPLASAKSY